MRHGAALWQLLLFGGLTMPAGAWLWRGLGPHFGLTTGSQANRRDGWAMLGVVGFIVALELWRT